MTETNRLIDPKAAEEAIAAQRPKITVQEAMRRRAESLKRFKKFELISFTVLIVVLILIQFRLFGAAGPDASSESLFNYILAYFGAIMVYVALMLRQGMRRMNRDDLTISEDKSDSIFRGWFLSWILPIVAILILVPALSTGMFNDDGINAWGAGIMFTVFIFVAYLFSVLFAVFVLVPLEFIIRGLVPLLRGDTSKIALAVAGLAIAGITAFILIGASAVEASLPYPVGSAQAFLAIIGVPGGYEVKSEPLLWVARGIFIFYIVLFFAVRRAAKREKVVVAGASSTK